MDQNGVKKSGGRQVKRAPLKTTEPQEFSLTKPKPRPLPMPELIPQQEKWKPVPHSTYTAPKEMQIIEEIKQKNRERTEELLYEANMKQIRNGHPHKFEHTKRAMTPIKEDVDSKSKFPCNTFRPPPSNMNKQRPIKLNSAAILRQQALCNRLEEEELQRMERLLEGEREASSFLLWQREMRERDLQEELAKIERRHLEGRISYEEATKARTRVMERNQRAAQLTKEETAVLMREYAEKRLKEEKEMRELVQQVAEGHKNSQVAKEKLQKFKQSIAKEVSEQSRELLQQALEEAQAELSRKFEIMREIRIMELLPRIRVKHFDETETAGHDLLHEMSLAELKERLSRLREFEHAEQREKREHILQVKQSKKQLLQEHMDTIYRHRRAQAMAASFRKEEERKAKQRVQQAVAQDEKVLALQKKLEEKQQERQRLKEAEHNKAKAAESHKNESLKEINWEELELNLEHNIQNADNYLKKIQTLHKP